MRFELSLQDMRAVVESYGGELVSLTDQNGTEYIWGGEAPFWSGRNPVLFPIVGKLKEGKALLIGGIVVVLMGIGLIVYYLTFGVYYDDNSFILASFGKKSETYSFRDIKEQRLYTVTGGSSVIELHLTDGRALSLHSTMEGTYPFLDHAFYAWCRQTGRKPEECDFHDPSKSCWFPGVEVE